MTGAALITGGSRRIGAAIADHLATQGWRVIIHSRRPNKDLEQLLRGMRDRGGDAHPLYGDLFSEDAVRALVGKAEALAAMPLSLLVNNASVFEDDTPETASWERLDRHMTLHVKVPLTLAQGLAQRSARHSFDSSAAPDFDPGADPQTGYGKSRLIVNIIDQRVWRLNPLFTSYTLSKASQWTLTQVLAQALAPRIRVNAIGPGPTLPNPLQGKAGFVTESRAVPLQQATDPGDIARAVSFLWASPAITGQMLALDGGQHLAWQTPDVMIGEAAKRPAQKAGRHR